MNEIIVLGRPIKIKVVSQKEVEVRANEKHTLGFYLGHEDVIYLSRTLDEEGKRRVLLHELFHAFLYISGVSEFLEDKSEEAICNVSENYLELFRNKDFTEFLKKKGS